MTRRRSAAVARPRAGIAVGLAGCLLALATLQGAALAGPAKLAVFPLEVPDVIRDGEYLPRPNTEDQPRIAMATAELARLLGEGGRYEVVDLGPLAAELKAAQPLHKCNGCEMDLARKAGADLLVLGLVEKASDVLLNMSIEIKDVASGKPVRIGGTVIQGNTDDMWMRSVRYIVKNRLISQEGQK